MIVLAESIVLERSSYGWQIRHKPYAKCDCGDDTVQLFVGEGAESGNEARVRE